MILDQIVAHKRTEVEAAKQFRPLDKLQHEIDALPPHKPVFLKSLKERGPVALIAEIKRKSPSKGVIREHFEPGRIARDYESAGAAAISVLTDEKFFGGSAEILREVRRATGLPILRKDFVIDEYQVYEARFLGADAVLLIAAILDAAQLKKLFALAASLGLDALFEVHTQEEADKVKALRPKMVGINNRDLGTFEVDTKVTERLAPSFIEAGTLLVSESGIQSHQDLLYLKRLGVSAVLVGESLMREQDVLAATRRLLGKE